MELYELIASWAGWPMLVAALLLLGGAAIWFLRNRLEYQKEINDQLRKNLEYQKETNEQLRKNLDTLHKEEGTTSEKPIRYRAEIKLIHEETAFSLHSHSRNYEHSGSSMQQQITAFDGSNKDDYWIVKGPHNFSELYKKGEIIQNGDIIRLEHVTTRKNLHSHKGKPSPITEQQEVTGFGTDGIGDPNDNWRVDIEDGGIWQEGANIRLIHQQTGAALHSHKGHNLPEYGYYQQEVTCFQGRNKDDWWRAAIFKDVL